MKSICDWIDAIPLTTLEIMIILGLICFVMLYRYVAVFIKYLWIILRYGIDEAEIRAYEELWKLRMENKRLREAGEGKP
jgi:hypothetical protein